MDRIPVFVGMDYHQDSVQVCIEGADGRVLANRKCANDIAEIVDVAERCGEVAGAAIESCSGAADLAEELVTRAGWPVDLAHPGFVGRMKQNPDKTDFSDAHLLADLERVGYLPRVWLAPQEVRELRRLMNYRQQLVKERTAVKLRIRSLLRDQRVRPPFPRAWTRPWTKWVLETEEVSEQSRWILKQHFRRLEILRKDILEVEKRTDRQTAKDAVVQALLQYKGIGPITACMFRAHIGRFDRFRTAKQLSRYCGLSPRNASSGKRQADAGLIRAGDPVLRATLVEAAHRLMRYDDRWVQLARNMRARGKPVSLIAAAVANRWVRWLFHQMQPCTLAACA